MAERDPIVDKAIEDALDQLLRMEKLLQNIDRNRILTALELLKKALENIDDLQEAIEAIPHTELDMRMARLRIQAATGLQPPSLASDPDKTPVEPIQARKPIGAPVRSSETMRGMGVQVVKPPLPKKQT